MMRQRLWTMAGVLLLAGPAAGGQSTTLDSSEANAFIGTWVIAMQIPEGAQETVRIWNKDGKVAASVQAKGFPPLDVRDITKVGDSLVLTIQRWENGKPIKAVITLTLDGEKITMTQDLEGSRVRQRGSGKKQ